MLKIDTDSGRIFTNETLIAPLLLKEFINALEVGGIKYDHCIPNAGWHNIGFVSQFYKKEFSVVSTYREEVLRDIFLSWHGGKTGAMGYEVTEKALRADQRELVKFLESIFHRLPDEKKDHLANFFFIWGCVTANYSIRSLTVGISITWNKPLNLA